MLTSGDLPEFTSKRLIEDDLNGTINSSILGQFIDTSPTTNAAAWPLAGSVIASERWRDSELSHTLQKTIRVVYINDKNDVVDFYPSSNTAVMYLAASDLACVAECKRKLVKLRNKKNTKGIVFAEYTIANEDDYLNLQKFAVLDLGLAMLPVSFQCDTAMVLSQMVSLYSGIRGNPFKTKRYSVCGQDLILNSIQAIPGLGEIKAKHLLDHFGSLHDISNASVDDLTRILGKAKAMEVWQLFR